MATKKINKEELEAKKAEDTAVNNELDLNKEIDPEVLAKARVEMREVMREKFGKWIEVYDDDANDDDIQAARDYFESEVEKYKQQTYTMADNKEDAIGITSFLINWNGLYNHWKNAAWKGIITFNKIMSDALTALNETEDLHTLELDYQTLMFIYQQMQSPEGMGLTSALEMAEMENYDIENNKLKDNDVKITYTYILSKVYEHIQRLSLVDKMLNLMRERVTIAAAGIKFDFKITELEEFKELSDAWVVSDTDKQMKNI